MIRLHPHRLFTILLLLTLFSPSSAPAGEASMAGEWEGTYLSTDWELGTLSVTVRHDGGEYTADVRVNAPGGSSRTPVLNASGTLSGNEFTVIGSAPAYVMDANWSSLDVAMSGTVAGNVWSGTLTRKTVVDFRLTLDELSGEFRLERSGGETP